MDAPKEEKGGGGRDAPKEEGMIERLIKHSGEKQIGHEKKEMLEHEKEKLIGREEDMLLGHEKEKMIGHKEHLLLKNKHSDLENSIKRLQAEFENFQKRTEKETKIRAESEKASLLKELLPVLDEMEEAKKHTKDEGVKMVFEKLKGALSSAGLREIEAEGIYDPSMHEVVGTKLAESDEGTVVDIVRKGYVLGETVLRPSMIIISKK